MLEIEAYEAENKFGLLLDRVQDGEEILITRHGKPVATLAPNPARTGRPLGRTQQSKAGSTPAE